MKKILFAILALAALLAGCNKEQEYLHPITLDFKLSTPAVVRNVPFTPKALRMIISKVRDLSGGDIETSKAVLYQSIEQGWKGVYPVKPGERDKPSESNNPFLDMLREEGQFEQAGNP